MNREQHGEIMRQLEQMNAKLSDVENIAKENRNELRRVILQQTIHPVPRPRQRASMNRGTNVTRYMRQYAKEKNATMEEKKPRYLEFSEDIDDKQYNTDAMNCLECILGLHLGSDLGVLTWDQVCKRYPGKMGLIIKDSINAPELIVFSQAAGQWAIQMLIANKMNSRLRYNRDHSEPQSHEVEFPNLAPTTVPDMNGELQNAEGEAPVIGYLTTGKNRKLTSASLQTVHEVEHHSVSNGNRTATTHGLSGARVELTRRGLPNEGSSTFHHAIATHQQPQTTERNNQSSTARDQQASTLRGGSISRGRIGRSRGARRSVSIRGRSSSKARRAANH